MIPVVYPTLDVFLYSLAYSLGDSEAEKQERQLAFIHFLRNWGLDEASLETVQQQNANISEVDLLAEQQLVKFSEKTSYEGYLYPKRLNDCYALLLDCSIEDSETNVYDMDDLSWLGQLQEILQQKKRGWDKNQQVLGETWMLSFAVTNTAVDYEAIARACCHKLLPAGAEYSLQSNHFLGGILFVVNYFVLEQDYLQEQQLFIGIYPDKTQVQTLARDYYERWLNLCHCQNKIDWAYGQSRQLKQRLLQAIPEIRRCRQAVQVEVLNDYDLIEIERTLNVARIQQFEYAENLRLLLDQANTIETNLYNYRKCLAGIRQLSGDGLGCFDRFAGKVEQHHLLQVQKDHDNLSLEMDLLDKLVAHIGINIALRKEQRDRKFIQRVEVFGILFALAAIIIGSSGDFPIKTIAQAKHNPIGDFLSVYLSIPDAWLDVGISITVSLLVPIILGLIWSLTRLVSWVRTRKY